MTPQRFTCPEAEFWNIGDFVMVGKGERASIFRVVERLSPATVKVVYKREMKEAPAEGSR